MTTAKYIRKFLGLLALMLIGTGAYAQVAKVHGTVTDEGETMPLTQVNLKRGEHIVRQSMTDADGKYEFAILEPGSYVVEVVSGDKAYRFQVTLAPGETKPRALEMETALLYDLEGNPISRNTTKDVIIYGNVEPFSVDPIQPITVTKADLGEGGIRGIQGAMAFFPDAYQEDAGASINLQGSRDNATAVFVDGVKINGNEEVSQAAISQITMLSGGIPAEYGDFTGGIIIIQTNNPGMKGIVGKKPTREERQEIKRRKRGSNGVFIESMNPMS